MQLTRLMPVIMLSLLQTSSQNIFFATEMFPAFCQLKISASYNMHTIKAGAVVHSINNKIFPVNQCCNG